MVKNNFKTLQKLNIIQLIRQLNKLSAAVLLKAKKKKEHFEINMVFEH